MNTKGENSDFRSKAKVCGMILDVLSVFDRILWCCLVFFSTTSYLLLVDFGVLKWMFTSVPGFLTRSQVAFGRGGVEGRSGGGVVVVVVVVVW